MAVNKIARSKKWLDDVSDVAKGLYNRRKILAEATEDEEWKHQVFGKVNADAEELLLEANDIIGKIGGVEADYLRYRYIFNEAPVDAADSISYSVSHSYRIEKRAMEALYDYLPDKYKRK